MKLLWWIRRDLRLHDNPAIAYARENGCAIQPIYIHAPDEEAPWQPGAASNWWLRESLKKLQAELRSQDVDLWVANGDSEDILLTLLAGRAFSGVIWNRLYEPAIVARDRRVAAKVLEAGHFAKAFPGHLLREPHQVRKGDGSPYRVFTPYWKAAQNVPAIRAPDYDPTDIPWLRQKDSQGGILLTIDELPEFAQQAWQESLAAHQTPGEQAARERLLDIQDGLLEGYGSRRDLPAVDGTSQLSAALHFGEISVAEVWKAADRMNPHDRAKFRAELGWREFAHHLLAHFPDSPETNFNPRFENYPWARPDANDPALRAWQKGQTGITMVDAGMQQLWQSGWMHNRVRMLVGSLLTKNLNIHWQYGARWFWDTLVDADLASNTLGWQWVAGCGADAAPFFRIFNPDTQGDKFDSESRYRKLWLTNSRPDKAIVDLKASRAEALASYKSHISG